MTLRRTSLLRRTPLARVSKKRAKALREYAKKRKAFLAAHPFCQVRIAVFGLTENFVIWAEGKMPNWAGGWMPRATEVHHKAGRSGKNFLDESTWMAVSREGHRWLHNNPREARARGWIL